MAGLFEVTVAELDALGATLVDIEIPQINESLDRRAGDSAEPAFQRCVNWNGKQPFGSHAEMLAHSDHQLTLRATTGRMMGTPGDPNVYFEYLKAREQLETNVLKVMADNNIDVIVHRSVEHSPTLIADGVNPPYVDTKGVPRLNTFLVSAASMTVPAGFTPAGLPIGVTFFGRPYTEPLLIGIARACERSTRDRLRSTTTPPLPGEPR